MLTIDELKAAIEEAGELRAAAAAEFLRYPAKDSPEGKRLWDREYRLGLLISGLGQALRALTRLEELGR
jgi:hypothetical protein